MEAFVSPSELSEDLQKTYESLMEERVIKLLCWKNVISYQAKRVNNSPGYTCDNCKDSFSSQLILDFHITRFSFHVKYYCDQCKQLLHFTNKCALHLHVNSHKIKSLDFNNIKLESLKKDDLIKRYSDILKPSNCAIVRRNNDPPDHTPRRINKDHIILSRNNQIRDDASTASTSRIVKQEENHNTFIDMIDCPICKITFVKHGEFSSKQLLNRHFQTLDDSMELVCGKCDRFSSNACAKLAHEYFEMKKKPYICPECGITFTHRQSLQYHLANVCFHVNRMLLLRCAIEGCTSAILETGIKKHIESHYKLLIKCSLCFKFFDDLREFGIHIQKTHDGAEVVGKNILVCPICNTIVDINDSTHSSCHIKDTTKSFYVYVCEGCKVYVTKKEKYKQHLMSCLPFLKLISNTDRRPNLLILNPAIKKAIAQMKKAQENDPNVGNLNRPIFTKEEICQNQQVPVNIKSEKLHFEIKGNEENFTPTSSDDDDFNDMKSFFENQTPEVMVITPLIEPMINLDEDDLKEIIPLDQRLGEIFSDSETLPTYPENYEVDPIKEEKILISQNPDNEISITDKIKNEERYFSSKSKLKLKSTKNIKIKKLVSKITDDKKNVTSGISNLMKTESQNEIDNEPKFLEKLKSNLISNTVSLINESEVVNCEKNIVSDNFGKNLDSLPQNTNTDNFETVGPVHVGMEIEPVHVGMEIEPIENYEIPPAANFLDIETNDEMDEVPPAVNFLDIETNDEMDEIPPAANFMDIEPMAVDPEPKN